MLENDALSSVPLMKDSSATLTGVVVALLKRVIYRDGDPELWSALLKLQMSIRDYIKVLNLELILDEVEGYAFLRSIVEDEQEEKQAPSVRLVARRPLSFPVSLLLALLRKKLAEFDSRSGDTKLVLSREEIAELIRVFLPVGSNETKLLRQVDAHINKIVELGFLRRLKAQSSRDDNFEVLRIIKAFVDAQWLSEFNERLEQYSNLAAGEDLDG